MKERPILFSAPMVRAIIDGRKTQTRRVIKPQPTGIWGSGVALPKNILGVRSDAFHLHANVQSERRFLYCPYGQPGDHLWVRESIHRGPTLDDGLDSGNYAADGQLSPLDKWCWKRSTLPSIHCPRGLSRITLKITDVRVERLQEISEEDARAEGVWTDDVSKHLINWPTLEFRKLWDSINGERASWGLNPWVWIIEFRRIT